MTDKQRYREVASKRRIEEGYDIEEGKEGLERLVLGVLTKLELGNNKTNYHNGM